jgi:hypothetical protein
MIDLNAICDACGEPYSKHRLMHPRAPRVSGPPAICPLCGGKTHRKGASDTTEFECAWRQWAIASKRLSSDANPEYPQTSDVPRVTPQLMIEFAAWRAAHPDLEAGEVPASRILRQRARAEADASDAEARRAAGNR